MVLGTACCCVAMEWRVIPTALCRHSVPNGAGPSPASTVLRSHTTVEPEAEACSFRAESGKCSRRTWWAALRLLLLHPARMHRVPLGS